MIDNKTFYKNVSILVLPMAIQNLINVGISSTDVIMLGKIGEKTLSGASLGSQVYFILNLILFGLTSGASVLIAQYWGKKDMKTIHKIFGIEIKFAVVVSALFMLVTLLLTESIMHIFSNDPEVIKEGVRYLRVVSFSYVLSAITMVYLNTMRSMERVKIATIVYLCSLFINIIANYLLIFTPLQLGVQGAAIGTCVARVLELLIVIFYDRKCNKVFRFQLQDLVAKDSVILKDFLQFSMPVVFNELAWGTGVSAISAILGHLGSAATAANSSAQVARQLAMVIGLGMANAAAIMIGKAIGEGKLDHASVFGRKFVQLSVITGILGALVILIARPVLLNFLVLTPTARDYLSSMMFVMAYFVIAQSINTTLIVGIFRAGGDTRFGLLLDASTLWGVAIVLGCIGAFLLKLPVIVVYMLLLSDEIIKIPLSFMRYRSYKWLKNVTKDIL